MMGPPQPPGQDPTLADVNEPQTNWLDRYQQNLARVRQSIAPLKASEAGAPSILRDIFSFGEAGRQYHSRVNQINRGLELEAMKMAFDATKAEDDAQGAIGRSQLQQLNTNLRLMQLQLGVQNLTTRQAQDAWRRSLPPTEQQILGGAATGKEYDPASGMWHPSTTTTTTLPGPGAAPGSPLAGALETTGAPSAGPAGRTPLENLTEYKAKQASAVGKARTGAQRLEVGTQDIVSGMHTSQQLIDKITTQFSPAELAKYLGVLRYPGHQAKQLLKGDPRFQDLDAMVSQLKQQQFSFGGKNLTAMESRVVQGFMPTGSEWGGGGQFLRKATQFHKAAQMIIDNRLGLQGAADDVIDRELTRKLQGAGITPGVTEGGGGGGPMPAGGTTAEPPGAPTAPTGSTGLTPGGIRWREVQ
jgi:hypothetical protein